MTPHSRVLLTPLGDDTGVLLHLDTKVYYTLNPTGVFVWEGMAKRGHTSIEALVAELTEAFDVTEDQARSDVEELISELRGEGLVL